ncbi:MAG: high-potential iron-sulfur protein [Sandaracinaceae bacterium]|nr:high-potential iron-sulfur protein [Sandaracinaceae bacterium]
MSDSKIGRRDAARRALTVLGAVMVAPSALVGCGGEEGGGALTCTDTTGLAAAAVATRESQNYTDSSPNAEQKCSGCRFFTAGQAGHCGTCQVVQGPIHPDGNCSLWAAQS